MEQQFTDFWSRLDDTEKYELALALSEKCGVAPRSVYAWGQGYRTPLAVRGVNAKKYMKAKYKVLITFNKNKQQY